MERINGWQLNRCRVSQNEAEARVYRRKQIHGQMNLTTMFKYMICSSNEVVIEYRNN